MFSTMHVNQFPQLTNLSLKPHKHVYAKSTQRRERKLNLPEVLVASLFSKECYRRLSLL